jgi:hypothetical protein
MDLRVDDSAFYFDTSATDHEEDHCRSERNAEAWKSVIGIVRETPEVVFDVKHGLGSRHGIDLVHN